ncbi:MAG: histidine kinase [Dehalococcoidia bacterium]
MDKTGRQDITKARESITPPKNLAADDLETRLKVLLKVAPSGIVIVEKPDGRISYANDRALELYGVDPRGLEMEKHSSQAMKLVTPDGAIYPPEKLPASRALLHGETVYNEELIIEQPGGKRIWVAASATPVLDDNGEVTAAVGIFDDVTTRKQEELVTQEHREHLEELVRQRTEELLRANRELRQEILEHEQAEKRGRALSSRLINAEERERRRVGQVLHDQLGSSLTLLKLATERAKQASGAEQIGEALKEIEKIADEIYEEVRTLSHSLRPDVLDDLGLAEALAAHFEEYTERCGIEVCFTAKGLEKRLPAEIEITAFRIVQESLVNVLRHAKANKATVVLASKNDALRLQIRDDGCGFDPARTELHPHGISGMQDRAYLVGGTLTVDSSPGAGTCVSCELPIVSRGGRSGKK